MHYRKNRRFGTRPDPQLLTSACLVAVVYIAIVFALGASRIGTWAARTVAAPVFIRLIGAGESLQTDPIEALENERAAVVQPETIQLELPEAIYYALQMGAYENVENAKKQAALLKALGAGGYIRAEQSRYVVLAAAYADQESLKKVRAQLAEENVDSTSCILSLSACTLSVTAEEAETDAYRNAFIDLTETVRYLSDEALDFDRQGKSAETGIALCRTMSDSFVIRRDTFSAALSRETGVSEAVCDFYDALVVHLSDAAETANPDTAAVSAALKYAAILAAECAANVYRAVESA